MDGDYSQAVSRESLERELNRMRTVADGLSSGVFGPRSLTRQIDRKSAIFLGAGRAPLLQLSIPLICLRLPQKSPLFCDVYLAEPKSFCNGIVYGQFAVQNSIEATAINAVMLRKSGLTPFTFDCGSQQANNIFLVKHKHAAVQMRFFALHDGAPAEGSRNSEHRSMAKLFTVACEPPAAQAAYIEPFMKPTCAGCEEQRSREAVSLERRLFRLVASRGRETARIQLASEDVDHYQNLIGRPQHRYQLAKR
ncbi:MAG: hypothetical protein WAK67_02195 [Xanthobacteraceae bacterium]